MSLESLVGEIRARGESELFSVGEQRTSEEAAIATARDEKIAALRADAQRSIEIEASRLKAQRVAAAKLASRKLLYSAREQRLERSLEETRTLLAAFTDEPEYANVLKRMFATASSTLGTSLKVSGRADDAALLKKIVGKTFDATARPIVGGMIAETPDGHRRLDFSFDELLRLRGDRVRELVA